MKVFVTGSTGYIGQNVASAFRRAGHEVWGLARSQDKAAILIRHEIHPVIGSMQNPESYLGLAEACSLLVHAASDQKADAFALDRRTVESFLAAAERGARPKTILLTSGVWVYGQTGDTLVDETTPLAPARLVSARPGIEQMVLNARGVSGIVLRPGCVYGRQGSLTSLWFKGAREGALNVVGDGNNRWPMVHVDDLAEAYLRAGESGLGGEVFNITDRSRSTVREMVTAAARAAAYDGRIHYIPVAEAKATLGDFAECLALDQHVDGRKAVRMLGWQPRHGGFADDAGTYFESWKAAQPA